MLREFTIADLGVLNTAQALFLHNQTLLTRGPAALIRRSLLAPLASLTGVYTVVCGELIGQAQRFADQPLAALTFLSPPAAAQGVALTQVVEYFLKKLGPLGVQGLQAELDENSATCAALQQAGFSLHARQRIWKLTHAPAARQSHSGWRVRAEADELAVHLLCQSQLPATAQHSDLSGKESSSGYVYYVEGQLAAFAAVKRGPQGTWAQLFAERGTFPLADGLTDLLISLRPRPSRPLYFCVRDYQDWLEPALEQLDGQPGPRQAALVRRTVLPLKVKDLQRAARAAFTEPTTPIRVPVRHAEPEWMNYDQTPNHR